MTDRQHDHAQVGPDGPTRDIRMPPLPPPPYQHHAPDNEPTDRLAPPEAADRQNTVAFDSAPGHPGREHGQPPLGVPGSASPATSAPGSRSEPGPAVPRDRKWPWVLLILLPIVVIVAAGLLLALVLGG
jgi:hypothetical protein